MIIRSIPPLVVAVISLPHTAAQLQWEELTGYPGPGRHHPITFANETHGFLLTGTTLESFVTNDFYVFEEASGEWTDLTNTKSQFPGDSRSFGYGVVLPQANHPKAYIGMGLGTQNFLDLNDLWEFDMQTHAWRQLASLPGPGHRHPAMNVVETTNGWEIHVGFGDNQVLGNLRDWWIYDIETDTWKEGPSLPGIPRHHPFYFSLGQYSYAGLGLVLSETGTVLKTGNGFKS